MSDEKNNLEELQKQLEETKKQAEEYLSGWKRAKADLLNFQKQTEKEKEEWAIFFQVNFAKAILPALDSLAAAAEMDKTDGCNKIYQQFIAILKQMGMESIKAVGETVNPELHEVVGKDISKEVLSGVIVKEVQKGYLLSGKLLRPSKVIVAEGRAE